MSQDSFLGRIDFTVMETLTWIQDWFKEQCDGYWEHSYSIKIETLDNPGWSITINLEGTSLENTEIEYQLFEKAEDDWYGFKSKNNLFEAVGDPNKLQILLEKFREIATNSVVA